jgi:hypothetical protein
MKIDRNIKGKLMEILSQGFYVSPSVKDADSIRYISYYRISNMQDVYALISSLDKNIVIANIITTDNIRKQIKEQL